MATPSAMAKKAQKQSAATLEAVGVLTEELAALKLSVDELILAIEELKSKKRGRKPATE